MNDITRMLELAGLGHSPKQYEIAEQPSADHNVKVDTDFEQLVDYVRQLDRDGDIDISEPNAAQSIDALLAYEEPVGDQIPPTIDDIQAAINQVLHTSQIDVGSTVEIDQGPSRGQVGQVVEVSAGGGFVLVQTPQGQEYVPINEVSIKEDMLVPLEQNSMDENAFNTARDQAIAAGHNKFEFGGKTYPVTDVDSDDVERAKTRFDVTESVELSYERYHRVHGKKPSLGPDRIGRYMFTTVKQGDPESSEVFTFTGTGTDAGAAAKKWAKEQGKSVVYIMESEFDDMESEFDDMESEFDDEQGFFVVLASEEKGVFIGMISQEDGRWRESVVSGTPPTNWGGAKYMSYLTAQDVMMWLEKDYGTHYEVLGPFSEDEAKETAGMFESVPATTSSENGLEEGVNDPHIFKCIFLFGPMGAGKSTVARPLLAHTGLRSINLDNFNELLIRKGQAPGGNLSPDQLEKNWTLTQKQQANFVNGRLGIIIDGSGRNPETAWSVIKQLEPLGYQFMMIFVNVSLETSIARQQSRAQKQAQQWGAGRQVSPELATSSYEQVQDNLQPFQKYFGQNFIYIDNENTPDLQAATKQVNAFLRAPLTTVANQWVQAQKSGQQESARAARRSNPPTPQPSGPPATTSTAMKKVEAYSPGVYETLADKFGMVLEFSNTEDVLIPVQHEDRVLEFLLNQGYVEGHDFDLFDSLEEVDLQNGYRSQHSVDGNDYFPSAVTGPAAKRLGPGAEKHANNPLFTQRK